MERHYLNRTGGNKINVFQSGMWITAVLLILLASTVTHAQPVVWGSATPSVIGADTQTVTLSWGSTGADYCEADGVTFPTSGSVTSGPFPAGNHSQQFSCSNSAGTSYYTLYWSAEPPASGGGSSCSAYSTAPANAVSLALGTHTFSVTGTTAGGGWGTNQYTHDSTIAAMAVHAGVINSGQSAIIQVHRTGGLSSYTGSTQNGVTTSSYGSWSGTYSLSLVSLCGTSSPTVPATPTVLTSSNSTPTAGQSYTLSWNAVSGATSYTLYQNGAPTTLSTTSHTIASASQGTFSYTVNACNTSGCSAQSAAVSVVVNGQPLPDPLFLIGFDGEYSAYWPTSAATSDLYVVRNNTDGNYEGVAHFILAEQTDGSYTLNANPTSAQISQFNLATPAAIAYELADINLDGAMDMVLMDSGNIASGIVYAATSSQSAPIGYKHIDEEFIEFFADLYQGIIDPDYFDNTAEANGWGQWEVDPNAPYIFSYWDTAILHLSGQTFEPVDLPPPSEPIPFYSNVSDAYNPNIQPFWCAINGQGGYRWNGVWEVLGWYREADFVLDYSNFNQDAMEVATLMTNYLSTETSAVIQTVVFQIIEDILGVSHDLDDEPAIFNLIKRMGQVLFGIGVEQETVPPQILAKVELLYTDLLNGVIPYARHAYLQVTFPNGNRYVTAGWPEDEPTFPPFGYLSTAWAVNPTSQEQFEDYGKPIRFRQLIGHSTLSEASISGSMITVTANVNSCVIPYLLGTYNSNSYAFQSVPVITGLPRPRQQAWAPGSGAVIPCP